MWQYQCREVKICCYSFQYYESQGHINQLQGPGGRAKWRHFTTYILFCQSRKSTGVYCKHQQLCSFQVLQWTMTVWQSSHAFCNRISPDLIKHYLINNWDNERLKTTQTPIVCKAEPTLKPSRLLIFSFSCKYCQKKHSINLAQLHKARGSTQLVM